MQWEYFPHLAYRISLNADTAEAAAYLRQFRRSHNLELGDALIAATALQTGADLVTRNLKHYPMTDIRVVAPYERGQR